MNGSRGVSVALVLAAGLVGAASVEALDLTGTWQGQISCSGLTGAGDRDRFRVPNPVEITQVGDAIRVRDAGANLLYAGRVIEASSNPDAGIAMFVGCPTDNTLPPDSELVHARVTVTPARGKLTATGPFHDADNGGFFLCRWSYTRVDTVDPAVPACP
jgi:hypothetical protein